MYRHLLCLAFVFVVAGGPPAAADDEEDGGAKHVTAEWSLATLRAPAPVGGPRLSTPADFHGLIDSADDLDAVWDYVGTSGETWIQFEESSVGSAPSQDALMEVLQTIHAEVFDSLEHHLLEVRDDRIVVQGTPGVVRDVGRSFDWVVRGMAPRLELSATYGIDRPEARTLASARTRLVPRRWSRVYLQQSEQPFCVDFDIEIAQEATAMDPDMRSLPEGQELYARFHPGESRSLLEVWCGEVEHTEVRRIDLGPVRNVPEGNAPGVISFPISRVLRAHTVLVLPNGRPSTHELAFVQDGRASRLTLSVGAPPEAHAPTQTERPRPLAILRTAAAAGRLDFGVREREPEAWIEQITSSALARGFEDDDLEMQVVSSTGCVFAQGLPRVLDLARETLRKMEGRLATHRAAVRVLTLAESTYRKGVKEQSIQLGKPIEEAYLASLRQAGSGTGARIELPLLLGVEAGFRVGYSEPGLYDFAVEVAQQAAGLDPRTTAHFRGLAGTLRAESVPGGMQLVMRGALDWADPEAGSLDLAFRTPVGMRVQHERWLGEPAGVRPVKLPAIGAGTSPLDAEVVIPEGSRGEQVLAVVVRGTEVQLVLGEILRDR